MNRSKIIVAALAVPTALAIAGCAAITPAAAPQPAAAAAPAPAAVAPAPAAGALAAYEGTLEQIYSQVNPSVVHVEVVEQASAQAAPPDPFGMFGGQQGQPQVQVGSGSGFLWDTSGHIVTNNHVVAGASKITVTLADGTTVPAKVVGADPTSDLAVIVVDPKVIAGLQPIKVGDSTQVKVGQLAIAIGNPFGLDGTMTTGIISAIGRSLPTGDGSAPSYTIPNVIQTDASINPGNSGGVLLDDAGRLIGVTAAIESPVRASSGVGFAIPAAIVQQEAPALIKDGHYDHPWLGLSGSTLTPDEAQAMGLPAGQRGALVGSIVSGGPADKAGLRGSDRQVTINGMQGQVGGDVITALDGQPVKDFDSLVAYLADHTKVGQSVSVTLLRDGKEQTVSLTLATRPSDPAPVASSASGQ
ncbi:trypsin-like peptidase domain-containing protein [Oscillochloris sp. ZM17-4]|uniref:S1C family serine protease n=1 Tax=Oscillochloris sp. ZM17-4 TaxID=2866714 RepID=UPI001C733BB5|nr:trypsin-like peptidase domain-containing protein [Oscillochloris sp. ZM17-4]MBX0330125.1 trypsin-like peptidase domain-containing protein [Oscillochloris sp. ZM17-4]